MLVNCTSLCVAAKHNMIIVSDAVSRRLHVYRLRDGAYLRVFGSWGWHRCQFRFDLCGLRLSPDKSSILVAERFNNRIQQVTLDGKWVRFIRVKQPQMIDCDLNTIVVGVEEKRRSAVLVLNFVDGLVRTRFRLDDCPWHSCFLLAVLGDLVLSHNSAGTALHEFTGVCKLARRRGVYHFDSSRFARDGVVLVAHVNNTIRTGIDLGSRHVWLRLCSVGIACF